jgi:hypothetical protein
MDELNPDPAVLKNGPRTPREWAQARAEDAEKPFLGVNS